MPNANKLSDHASDFLLFKLVPALNAIGVPEPSHTGLITWFVRVSKLWKADSQSEFDALARLQLQQEYEHVTRHDADSIKRIDDDIKIGAAKRIPAHLRWDKFLGYSNTGREKISSTGHVEDATQDGWVKLLEQDALAETVEDRDATNVGQTTGHDVTKEQRKYVTLPQTTETEDGEMATIAPWDVLDQNDIYRRNLDAHFERFFRNLKREKREQIIRQLGDEDFAFLVNYYAGRRKSCFTRAERNRAGSIVTKLRRIELGEVVEPVTGFAVGERVSVFDEGWRYGVVLELPIKGVNAGRALVKHSVRKVWVDGTALKKLSAEGEVG